MESKEKVKVVLFFMRFFIVLAVITLAATTAIYVYPSIYIKVIEINPALAIITASLGVLLVTGSIDGLAGVTYPAGIQMLLDKSKVKFSILLIIIGLGGYAASGTFSIWARDLVASKIVQKPNDNSMQLYEQETKTFTEGKAAFDEALQIAKVELEEAQKAFKLKDLTKNSSSWVQGQLEQYALVHDKNSWVFKKMSKRAATIRRAKRARKIQLTDAQKKYDKAQADQLAYIKDAGKSRDMKQSELKTTHTAVINKHESELNNIAGVVWLIDFIILVIILIGRPVELSYANAYNIEMPRNKSLGFALYKVSLALKNRFVWALEFITRIDIDGDGMISKPPKVLSNLPPNAIPVKFEKNLDSDVEFRLRSLEKESLENKNLVTKKTPKVLEPKKTPTAFSLNAPLVLSSKLIGIEKVEGFENLEKETRAKLLRYEKEYLSSKKPIYLSSKDCNNAFIASKKPTSKEITRSINKIKFLWLSEVLRDSKQSVKIIKGKLKIK